MAINRTARAIFDKAIFLIDEQAERTGATVYGETKDYMNRTIGILNSLIDVVYPVSDTFLSPTDGKRPALPDIESLDDDVDLDARVLRDILPKGLAAKLLVSENPALSNYFQQLFEKELAIAGRQIPATFESIDDALPYGGLEYGEFGRWA